MKRFVLDANAVLALVGNRSGAGQVEHLFSEARRTGVPLLMSVINWGEVISATWKTRGETEARRVETTFRPLPLALCHVDEAMAFEAARHVAVHRLPYADSFAAALAERERATLVTSDPDFKRLGKQLPILWLR
ncbi:MAG: PIN domain-containing protein [Terriglobales bacterium]